MEEFLAKLMAKATEYLHSIEELEDVTPPSMLLDFSIEKYKQKRNYPNSFSDERILKDLNSNLTTIAMAVVDLYMKIGAEGETEHQEKNITRVYENAYISASIFNDVLPFAKFY